MNRHPRHRMPWQVALALLALALLVGLLTADDRNPKPKPKETWTGR